MTPAEVLRIIQSLLIISAHIQDDRQRSFRTNPTNARVERELANRDAEPACALITDAQNAFAIGYHDYIEILIRAISQKLRDGVAQRVWNEQSARPAIDVAELFNRHRNRWRVNQRCHFFDVVDEESVKKNLVGVLEST